MSRANQITFTRLWKLLLGTVLASPAIANPPLYSVDVAKLLRAIAQVETGTTDLTKACCKIGKAGERSAWQMTGATWKRYTREPFAKASTDAVLAHLVASTHLRWLAARLTEKKCPVSSYFLALAWNAGPNSRYLKSDYAQRVRNLYQALP